MAALVLQIVELVVQYLEETLLPAERERFKGYLTICAGCVRRGRG
jgi:hypothetical protein